MTELVQVATTVDSEPKARAIADQLVTERLAACVQIVGPVSSVYHWNGQLERATEWLCLAKTTGARLDQLIDRIRVIHPYQQPEILATPVLAADQGYQRWVVSEVGPPSQETTDNPA
jgi:periplasmic divalent cation tolerance protein